MLVTTNTLTGYTAGNKVELVRGGKEYFDLLLQLIDKAKESIHLQTYIFDDDETGNRVAVALKAAVLRGVEVYLMADGYASRVMSNKFIQSLQSARINFRFFEPIFRSKYFYFGRRLHHKMVVIDTRFALVGGINITNRYNDMPDYPAWLDFALYAEGEIAKELCVLCWKTWKGFPSVMGITPCEEKKIKFEILPEESSLIRMRRNDWVRRKNQISRSYIEMLKKSETNITILCSYFLPGRTIMRCLHEAIKRGVKVKVILAGLSDVMLAKHAERYIYEWLLKNNIEIYEYQGTVLHGKMAVSDNKWMTLGSYNVNNISAYASIELNLDVFNPAFAGNAEEILNNIISDKCLQVTEDNFSKKNNFLKKFIHWSSYQIIKAGFYLFTFYFRQKN